MLPAEVVYEICNHLGFRDILTLSKVHGDFDRALKPLLKLLTLSPYYQLKYSQWDSWQQASSHFKPYTRKFEFKRAEFPLHVDEPLPDDFRLLQNHVVGTGKNWRICDRGVVAPPTSEVIDMRANPDDNAPGPTHPSLVPADPNVSLDGLVSVKDNAYVSTKTTLHHGSTYVLIKYRDGTRIAVCVDQRANVHHSYDLQLIDDVVFSQIVSPTDISENSISFILPGMDRPLPLVRVNCGINAEGLLLYDGHLYKAVVNDENNLTVATHDCPIRGEGRSDLEYNIYQDDRNPRYGLAYLKKTGVLIYVIDLLEHTVITVLQNLQFGFAGLSNGEPGVWQYTAGYLMSRFGGCLRSPALQEAVQAMAQDMRDTGSHLPHYIS